MMYALNAIVNVMKHLHHLHQAAAVVGEALLQQQPQVLSPNAQAMLTAMTGFSAMERKPAKTADACQASARVQEKRHVMRKTTVA